MLDVSVLIGVLLGLCCVQIGGFRAVTGWTDKVPKDMEILTRDHGPYDLISVKLPTPPRSLARSLARSPNRARQRQL